MIKYIDIEFSNQCVFEQSSIKSLNSSENITKFVDNTEQHQLNAVYFDGYLNVPPTNQLRLSQNKENGEITIQNASKCFILSEDRNENELKLLKLAECIRKFVVQYELSDSLTSIWPWYKNTFHRNDIKLYNDK